MNIHLYNICELKKYCKKCGNYILYTKLYILQIYIYGRDASCSCHALYLLSPFLINSLLLYLESFSPYTINESHYLLRLFQIFFSFSYLPMDSAAVPKVALFGVGYCVWD